MFTRKPLTLPPQLQWQYQDEPALAEWSLKARPYNTDIANGIFLIFLVICAVVSVWTGMDTAKSLGYQLLWGGGGVCNIDEYGCQHDPPKNKVRLPPDGLRSGIL